MLTIGKIATATKVTPDTLRYYEREGLVKPASKTASGYRLYGEDSLRRIRFIRHAQQCGFSLSEIRELLGLRSRPSACCGDVRNVALEKKLEIEAKIKSLQTLSHALDELIGACADKERRLDSCPILSALDENSVPYR